MVFLPASLRGKPVMVQETFSPGLKESDMSRLPNVRDFETNGQGIPLPATGRQGHDDSGILAAVQRSPLGSPPGKRYDGA
ncbi:hypothetical protein AY599_11105 [Leptolyngbya valderiana BDU 20041]|nr:hypothetical protein AY599_11105 [Leptolyngbya valderiana BDU 20041]